MNKFIQRIRFCSLKAAKILSRSISILYLSFLLIGFLALRFVASVVDYINSTFASSMYSASRRFSNIESAYNKYFKKSSTTTCVLLSDYPELQCGFQDPATPIMEGVIDLHNDIVVFLVIIVTLVIWMLSVTIFFHSDRYPNSYNTLLSFYDTVSYKLGLIWKGYNNVSPKVSRDFSWSSVSIRRMRIISHHDTLEIVWTAIPALIMLSIALPSFALLYSMDEVIGSALTLKIIGHQWYWHYEYSFSSDSCEYISKNEENKWVYNARYCTGRSMFCTILLFTQVPYQLFNAEPEEVFEAYSWLEGWFQKYRRWVYAQDFFLFEDRVWNTRIFKRLFNRPSMMTFDELNACKKRMESTFGVLRANGVTQADIKPYLAKELGLKVLADAIIAERYAWEKLVDTFYRWSVELGQGRGISSARSKGIQFDSYMLSQEDAPTHLRLLAVDKPVYLPVRTHVRLLVTSSDVLHSWAVPSFGIKLDACPGRLNQTVLYAKRLGDFYGQCSEICGINHGFMPIHVRVVDSHEFFNFISDSDVKGKYLAFSSDADDDKKTGESNEMSIIQITVYGAIAAILLFLGYKVGKAIIAGLQTNPSGGPSGGGGPSIDVSTNIPTPPNSPRISVSQNTGHQTNPSGGPSGGGASSSFSSSSGQSVEATVHSSTSMDVGSVSSVAHVPDSSASISSVCPSTVSSSVSESVGVMSSPVSDSVAGVSSVADTISSAAASSSGAVVTVAATAAAATATAASAVSVSSVPDVSGQLSEAISSAVASSSAVTEAAIANASVSGSSTTVSTASTVFASVTSAAPPIIESVLPHLYLTAVRRWIENDLPVLYRVHALMLEHSPGNEAEIAAKIREDATLQQDVDRALRKIRRLRMISVGTPRSDPNIGVADLVQHFFEDATSCKLFIMRILSSVERLA